MGLLCIGVAACGGGRGAPDWDPTQTMQCGELTIEPHAPAVVLLVDQSGSMSASFGSTTRWEALYDALMDSSEGVVKPLEVEVRFGLSLFTGGSNCPQVHQVAPDFSNYSKMNSLFASSAPAGTTPTGASIDTVVGQLDKSNALGSKLILLATDGEPNTCGGSDGRTEAVQAAQAAWDDGIRTVIFAVGDEVGASHQQEMANAGAGLDPTSACPKCAPTYQPTSLQEIRDVMVDIVEAERSCSFELNGELDPAKIGDGTFRLNGQVITYGDSDGFQINADNELELLGAACDDFLENGGQVVADGFTCDSFLTWPPEDRFL